MCKVDEQSSYPSAHDTRLLLHRLVYAIQYVIMSILEYHKNMLRVRVFGTLCILPGFLRKRLVFSYYQFNLLKVEEEFFNHAGHQISVHVLSSDTQNLVGGSFHAGE
jgi:hypothetical protein